MLLEGCWCLENRAPRVVATMRGAFGYDGAAVVARKMEVRAMARAAEAVVVGGGVNGASTLFHLAERGVKAILLERGEIAGASTGKSGGLVRMHYTDPYQARLANESLPYFADWQHRVGVGDPGFARTGFLQTVAEHNIPALSELDFGPW